MTTLHARFAFLVSITLAASGCYQSHGPSTDPRRCGREVCEMFEQCCLDCEGGGSCITLDLPCPPRTCAGCASNGECELDRYCRFPSGVCGGAGTCEPRPRGCFSDCPGACGCDGAFYCNECEAASIGVSAADPRACGIEFCGVFGATCGPGEICCPLCGGDAFCAPAGEMCPFVECPDECFSPFDCGPADICVFAFGSCRGPGRCEPVMRGCDDDCPGVCGCDGAIYCNECYALSAGVNVAPPDACGMTPCGRGGRVCAASEYCDLGPLCGGLDGQACREVPVVCDTEEDPVCGCDGVTYPNACVANASGVTVQTRGACGGCPDGECGFRTCREVQRADPSAASGVYNLTSADGARVLDVFCDMETDGGGWTLVASTRGATLDDRAGEYHTDLATTRPRGPHTAIWSGLRPIAGARSDVRFTCRSPRVTAMEVDLSFYDVGWYMEWTRGTDAESCFSEANGAGFDRPAPARRDNVAGISLPLGSPWMSEGYLEGEDSCDDTDDFTVDFRDRGMDSNERDGTDWGEDDGSPKCGSRELPDGLWHVWVRER